ncbi:MAG: chemotaxis protein CheW [Candidatus Hodarchaeales archaeon]|jgi:purine-binding chemotaxis protein CheW
MGLTAERPSPRFDTKDERRYVVFQLGVEKFGAPIDKVKEVIAIKEITPLPRAPKYVLGVMNLRGVICTVMDLSRRLDARRMEMKTSSVTEKPIAVIVEVGKGILGLAVDSVESITSIPFDCIEPNLSMVKKEVYAPFLSGVAKMSDTELIILLDLNIVFSEYEVEKFKELTEEKQALDVERDFEISQEELERLDLAFDDIDEIAQKSKEKEAKKKKADRPKSSPVTKPEKALKPQDAPKKAKKQVKEPLPAKPLEKPKKAGKKQKEITPAAPEPATPPKTKVTPPGKDEPPKTKVSPPGKDEPPKVVIPPKLSKKELKKLSKDELEKIALEFGIDDPAAIKKGKLIKLLDKAAKKK